MLGCSGSRAAMAEYGGHWLARTTRKQWLRGGAREGDAHEEDCGGRAHGPRCGGWLGRRTARWLAGEARGVGHFGASRACPEMASPRPPARSR
jgi:hypothetical protein